MCSFAWHRWHNENVPLLNFTCDAMALSIGMRRVECEAPTLSTTDHADLTLTLTFLDWQA